MLAKNGYIAACAVQEVSAEKQEGQEKSPQQRRCTGARNQRAKRCKGSAGGGGGRKST